MCAKRVANLVIILMLHHDPPADVLESLSMAIMRGAASSVHPRHPSHHRFGLLAMSQPQTQGPWATGASTPDRRSAALWALALGCYVATAAGAEGAPGGCERFRSGELVTERIEDFDLADPDHASVSFLELRYDPAYLFQPSAAPRPDGLPNREALFELNILTGAPLSVRERNDFPPQQEGTVTVLVSGARAIIDLEGVVRTEAIAPLDALYGPIGERLAGYERLDIPGGRRTSGAAAAVNVDLFAHFDEGARSRR